MQTIHFIEDYMKKNYNIDSNVSLTEYIDIVKNHSEDFDVSDDILYFKDKRGERHALYCVKKYFQLPGGKKVKGVNPNTMSTEFSECVKIKKAFLPPDDPVHKSIYWCPRCHLSCIQQYLGGKLEKRNS